MYVRENTALRRADIIIANFINSDRIKNTEGTARTVDERKITAVQDTISDHARSLRTGNQITLRSTRPVLDVVCGNVQNTVNQLV